tara:strand:- start:159 stop:350 length:192 start_codon:yes stop_codon:yes gene_type:complete
MICDVSYKTNPENSIDPKIPQIDPLKENNAGNKKVKRQNINIVDAPTHNPPRINSKSFLLYKT